VGLLAVSLPEDASSSVVSALGLQDVEGANAILPWAFVVNDPAPDDAEAPDPDEVVSRGGGDGVAACGYCHLPNGQGKPENAGLAGQPFEYILHPESCSMGR
jgi:cytochrome c553